MKTTTKKINVPAEEAYSYEETTYECEECVNNKDGGFKTKDEESAKKHYARYHAAKGKMQIDGTTFLKFLSEADYETWHEFTGDGEFDADRVYPCKWAGPGWYGLEFGNEPCGRGCCTKSTLRIYSANSYIEEWKNTIHEKVAAIRGLRKLINAQ